MAEDPEPTPRTPASADTDLVATACPAVQVPSVLLDPNNPALPATFSTLSPGASGPGSLTTPFNRNAAQAACIAEGGGGGYAVESGLTLATAGSLSLPIAAGRANIRGRITLPAATTHAVTASTARVYLWLSATGTITAVNNSVTPPSGDQCFIGSCVTGTSSILSVDFSGVMYLLGGALWRATADAGMPADTPPATISFYNVTAGGLYLWSGSRYWLLATP